MKAEGLIMRLFIIPLTVLPLIYIGCAKKENERTGLLFSSGPRAGAMDSMGGAYVPVAGASTFQRMKS